MRVSAPQGKYVVQESVGGPIAEHGVGQFSNTTVISGAGVGTYGVWSVVPGVRAADYWLLGFTLYDNDANIKQVTLQWATGAPGSEVAFADVTLCSSDQSHGCVVFPIPIRQTGGTALNLRIKDDNAAAITYLIGTPYYTGL